MKKNEDYQELVIAFEHVEEGYFESAVAFELADEGHEEKEEKKKRLLKTTDQRKPHKIKHPSAPQPAIIQK